VRVGCCGFPVARSRCYRHLDAVEVQKTFYALPREETLRRWKDEAPERFVFTVKAFQVITHPWHSPTYRRMKSDPATFGDPANFGFFRPTREVRRAWEMFYETVVKTLNPEVVVFQTPASFSESEEHVLRVINFFIDLLDNYDLCASVGWEPRGRWREETLRRIFNAVDIIHVVDPFKDKPLTSGMQYFRLHGMGGYRYRYTGEDLRSLREIAKEGYVMFNNVYMWDNALEFRSLLS